jgi:flap endonuclease-1
LKPELIELEKLLNSYGINREQLIDIALLIGTDFNEGVKGIGPKTALSLMQKHRSIDNLPSDLKSKLKAQNYQNARSFFLQPDVVSDYQAEYGKMNEEGLYEFLCQQRDFSRSRVETVILRMRTFYEARKQTGLKNWFKTD